MRFCVSVESDLDGHQHRRGDDEKQSDCIERGVEGDHGGLTRDGSAQQADSNPAGGHGVQSSCNEHGCRRGQPFADRRKAFGDVGAEHREIGGDVMIDQSLQCGSSAWWVHGSVVIDATQWGDDVRLSDLEPKFTCKACGRHGADVRPLFERAQMGT